MDIRSPYASLSFFFFFYLNFQIGIDEQLLAHSRPLLFFSTLLRLLIMLRFNATFTSYAQTRFVFIFDLSLHMSKYPSNFCVNTTLYAF